MAEVVLEIEARVERVGGEARADVGIVAEQLLEATRQRTHMASAAASLIASSALRWTIT